MVATSTLFGKSSPPDTTSAPSLVKVVDDTVPDGQARFRTSAPVDAFQSCVPVLMSVPSGDQAIVNVLVAVNERSSAPSDVRQMWMFPCALEAMAVPSGE